MVFPAAVLRGLLSTLILVLLCLWSPVQATGTILKSPNDSRQYEAFALSNGLKVLIVSDPDTDKSAAALDVAVGSGSDPEERQGLAHFLEHMLFLGTAKYPQAGEYQAFVSAHGGSHNAYTAFDRTNYFFDVDNAYLEPALDRFAQFFIAPLFTAEHVARERNIVDSEYQSKRKDDGWRGLRALQEVLNPRHPLARFSIGATVTLEDREHSAIRDELIRFYAEHYSANIMALTVLGKEPLAQLRQWVTKKFSAIQNTHASPLAISEPLFAPRSLPARLDIIPIKDERSLTLTFPIPAMDEHYLSKPTLYIANLLGYEGKGSLLSLLKREGWSDGIVAGQGMTVGKEAMFYVSVGLTKAGRQHISDVASRVFQYLNLIRTEGVSERAFDEQRRLAELEFRFQEPAAPMGYVSALAANLQKYPLADVVRGAYVMEHYDPALINRVLAALTPRNVLLSVSAKGLATDRVASWFDTPYKLSALDNALVDAWQTARPESSLTIPGKNIFLPDNLAAKPRQDQSGNPKLIKDGEILALWHQQDQTYGVPRADFYFSVRSPIANDSPRHAMLTKLYVKLVNDQINEFAYPAQIAGLSYTLYTHMRGFSVRISGFSDKQAPLLSRLAATLRRPLINPVRFRVFQEQLARGLENAAQEPPYTQALAELRTLLLKPYWDERELLAALKSLKPADLEGFIPELLSAVKVVVLSHGNIGRSEALTLAGTLETALLGNVNTVAVPRGQVVKLEDGSVQMRQLDIEHDDAAIAVYFQGNDTDFTTRARFNLLGQIVASEFFYDLRTVNQLGYVVFAAPMPLLEVPGLVFVVQSPVTDSAKLAEHVQRFIASYAGKLASMSAAVFSQHKRALITRILEKEKNLQERSNRYWEELDSEQYRFDSREQLAAAVSRISKDNFVAFFRETLLGKQRRQLMIYSLGSKHDIAGSGENLQSEKHLILNAEAFKQSSSYFPG